ncbi:MAG: hypothetical protein IJV98_03045 [Clostridia bacterium]|nr:hypothetical protein [Clostridia bacterium]
MIVKFAFRNLLRLPWRTILYFLIIFFIVVIMTASVFVCSASQGAKEALDENYVFVASLIPRDMNSLTLGDLEYCIRNTDVSAYNVTMSEANGCIPGGDSMHCLPSKENKKAPVSVWIEKFGCNLAAVENIALAHPFFQGECRILEGTGLTANGYSGAVAEIVIPWWLAEENGLSVGDTLIRRYDHNNLYVFMESTVVGIYESINHENEKELYPAYIPLAIAERDYAKVMKMSGQTTGIDRADFILRDRDGFEDFVNTATDNGLDLRTADLVFNNSVYDVLSAELDNIHTITVFVMCAVLVIGFGILLFFTIYLVYSRKQEKFLLASLGMEKRKIYAMMALEYSIIFVFAAYLGIGSGRLAADGVCSFVNDTVLERASASEELRILDSVSEFDNTMPLERNMKIEISVSNTNILYSELEINHYKKPEENEFGLSYHTYYAIGTSLEEMYESAWKPINIVGITDIGEIDTSMTYEDIQSLPNYQDTWIYAFVSKNSPYIPDAEKGRTILYITGDDQNSYVRMNHHQLAGEGGMSAAYLVIVGTYEENPYCSDEDILIMMEDYHILYSEFSIMDENFYFERIGEIYAKEGE